MSAVVPPGGGGLGKVVSRKPCLPVLSFKVPTIWLLLLMPRAWVCGQFLNHEVDVLRIAIAAAYRRSALTRAAAPSSTAAVTYRQRGGHCSRRRLRRCRRRSPPSLARVG